MKKPKRKPHKNRVRVVTRVSPEKPAARDEGPRLIPLARQKEPPPFQHYLELADAVLAPKKGQKP